MSNPRKALGTGLENRVVQRAQARGLRANRQPGSGMFRDYPNDVVIEVELPGVGLLRLLGECKVRSRHPSYIEMQEWLEGAQENARKAKTFTGAFLAYNVKGSRTPRVLLDLDLLLNLLSICSETHKSESLTSPKGA